MKSPEEYENQISLLKEALKFYADENNYHNDGIKSPKIIIDNGHQARFALELVDKIEKENEKIKEDYNRIIGETINSIENHPFDLFQEIKKLKNLKND